jgi:hypothetical protein
VSFQYLRNNHISYNPVAEADAKLTDGTMIRILGVTRLLEVKLGSLRFNHRFLVVDTDSYDCALGMSFLHQENPRFDWRARTMTVMRKHVQ